MERNRIVDKGKKSKSKPVSTAVRCAQCFGSGTIFNFLKSRTCSVCKGSCKLKMNNTKEELK